MAEWLPRYEARTEQVIEALAELDTSMTLEMLDALMEFGVQQLEDGQDGPE